MTGVTIRPNLSLRSVVVEPSVIELETAARDEADLAIVGDRGPVGRSFAERGKYQRVVTHVDTQSDR